MFKYDYNMLTDFPNAYNSSLPFPYGINTNILYIEVKVGVVESVDHINSEQGNNTVSIFFEKELTLDSQAKLDEIVAKHTGTLENLPQDSLLCMCPLDNTHIVFGGSSESQNYWATKQTTWTVARTFWFPGTKNTGIPNACVFVCNLSSNVTGYIRLVDITNNRVICTLTVPSGTTSQKVFATTPFSVPTDGAIIQIQASVSIYNNRYIYLYSFLMTF